MTSCELVVASSAVPGSDPELRAAEAADVPVWERPALLEILTARIPTIGVTGTHGKTTSTALAINAARALGLDPSFIVGGDLVDIGTNAHLGTDNILVLEADEAFGTFTHLTFHGLMVTNVDSDHLDHYGTRDNLEATFGAVVDRVAGPVVVGVDDPGGRRLARRTRRPGSSAPSLPTSRIPTAVSCTNLPRSPMPSPRRWSSEEAVRWTVQSSR